MQDQTQLAVAAEILCQQWGNIEKETLKKYLLMYGFDRWSKIRNKSAQSCKILAKKTDEEMEAMGSDFVRCLFANVQTEKNELKSLLLSLIQNLQFNTCAKNNSQQQQLNQ